MPDNLIDYLLKSEISEIPVGRPYHKAAVLQYPRDNAIEFAAAGGVGEEVRGLF